MECGYALLAALVLVQCCTVLCYSDSYFNDHRNTYKVYYYQTLSLKQRLIIAGIATACCVVSLGILYLCIKYCCPGCCRTVRPGHEIRDPAPVMMMMVQAPPPQAVRDPAPAMMMQAPPPQVDPMMQDPPPQVDPMMQDPPPSYYASATAPETVHLQYQQHSGMVDQQYQQHSGMADQQYQQHSGMADQQYQQHSGMVAPPKAGFVQPF